jgi:hypothetical protein
MLTINDAPIDWRPIGVDIKDRQKNPDAPRFCLKNLLLVYFNNISDPAISRSNKQIGTCRYRPIRISEKSDREKKKRQENERSPHRNKRDRHADRCQNQKNPPCFH